MSDIASDPNNSPSEPYDDGSADEQSSPLPPLDPATQPVPPLDPDTDPAVAPVPPQQEPLR